MDENGKKGGESLKLIRGRSYLQKAQSHRVDSGTVSLFALTSDLTNSETVAATL